RLFREFAVTLSVAIGVSLVISLTATPMMCAKLLKHRSQTRHGRFYYVTERGFNAVIGFYERSLGWVMRHQPVMLAVTLITIAFTIFLYIKVPKGFFPQQDTGRLTGSIIADQGTSSQAMNVLLKRFTQIVSADPAVDNVIAFTGGQGGASNTGRMFVALLPFEQRKLPADEVIKRLRGKLSQVPGASLFLQSVQDIRVGGRPTAAQYQFTLQGEDLTELNDWGPRVLDKMRKLNGLADVNSDQQNRGLQEKIDIDRVTAARLGVSVADIDNVLYDAFGQRQVSTMFTQLNQYHVVMEAEPSFWQNPDGLNYIYLKGRNGAQVPLSAVVHKSRTTTALAVNHSGQFPSVTISFNLLPGFSLGEAVTEIEQTEREMGLPPSIHGSFSGTAQAYQESLTNMPLLIIAALLTVYIVLGILYESYIHPITILSTLPSAGVGALLALLFTHTDLNVIGLIGIILLIGIVKKNAIMMIDFALEAERNSGKTPEQAIFQACVLRFRPIMMTTLAALFGGLPLAMGHGTGAELRQPLGIAIVGGLIFSQALTLYTTPVVYVYLDRLRLWFDRTRHRSPAPALPMPQP
ncbi:MAG: multidrug transporter, partial [Phycisphaerales bacterium]|nr:multidrug transporter [Phycisphaerales bacterium]